MLNHTGYALQRLRIIVNHEFARRHLQKIWGLFNGEIYIPENFAAVKINLVQILKENNNVQTHQIFETNN